jgi:hypothetical protein
MFKKYLKDQRGYLEYEMLFKLSNLSLVREIQIGMVNFQSTEAEVNVEPTTIIVQGGADRENLQHIVTLEVISDPAYAASLITVFAKNMQQYNTTAHPSNIADLIQSKLDSIDNFKCQWIKFSMRRNTFSCIENSPLANRLAKPHVLGISYISMQGYDLTQVKSSATDFIVKE